MVHESSLVVGPGTSIGEGRARTPCAPVAGLLDDPSILRPQKSILVLGLGNDILGDDAVGLRIARELHRRLPPDGDIEAIESCEMGLALLDLIVGYEKLVLVDSVKSGRAPAGTIHELPVNDVEILPLMAPHFFGIGEILALGRQLELPVPAEVHIRAIEVEDPFTVRDTMTATLEAAFPGLVDALHKWVVQVAGGAGTP